MALYEHFGALIAKKKEDVDYSKLLPAIPLLNAENEAIPKDEIRRDFMQRLGGSSWNELNDEASQLKAEYGLAGYAGNAADPLARAIEKLIEKLPRKPTIKQRRQLSGLVRRVNRLLGVS